MIAGKILYTEPVEFIAFQIDFDQMKTRKDVLTVIDEEIVGKVGKFSEMGKMFNEISVE